MIGKVYQHQHMEHFFSVVTGQEPRMLILTQIKCKDGRIEIMVSNWKYTADRFYDKNKSPWRECTDKRMCKLVKMAII